MEKILPWIALKNIPGVGNHLFKRLIDRFESPQKIFQTPPHDLMKVEGISKQLAGSIAASQTGDDVKREIDLAFQKKCRFVTLADPQYPALLRHIYDPPPFIYVKGELGNTENSIAMVGSRQASAYGISIAKRLGRDLAVLGFAIVSGMARGIDTAAHEGALSASGKTVAVLGSGLGVIYPPENKKLFHQIVENGAVISEFPVMEPPNAYNFPARNRIIAGMTMGTVVVEAAQKSGSLITARLAAEQGREVFAVPGSVHSFKSAGVHNLLKQGAKLVTSAQDIIEEFPCFSNMTLSDEAAAGKNCVDGNKTTLELTPDESKICRLLESYPIHIDDLSQKSKMNISSLAGILLNLELKGIVNQMPGKYFLISEVKEH